MMLDWAADCEGNFVFKIFKLLILTVPKENGYMSFRNYLNFMWAVLKKKVNDSIQILPYKYSYTMYVCSAV